MPSPTRASCAPCYCLWSGSESQTHQTTAMPQVPLGVQCAALPYPMFKSYLLLSILFFPPAFPKAMVPGPFTPFPWKRVITVAFPHTSLRAGGPDGCPIDPCPQMGRTRSPRCPHALAPPAFVLLWGPAAPNQPLRRLQLRLLRGKMLAPCTE